MINPKSAIDFWKRVFFIIVFTVSVFYPLGERYSFKIALL